jgi:cytochrome oxidase Cu insertion factor (SCO1/SenC/PrrC family)
MEKRVLIAFIILFLAGSITGFGGAYFYFMPQLRDANIEIDNLNRKLDLAAPDEPTASDVKEQAPDFNLIDLDENNFTLSDMKGKVILLDFMATWCGPCQASMPDLVELFEEMGDQIVMVSISIDPVFDSKEVLSSWRDQWNANWIHLRDEADPPVGQQYWIRAIPTYVIIDIHGNIQHRHIGIVPLNVLKSELLSLLDTV